MGEQVFICLNGLPFEVNNNNNNNNKFTDLDYRNTGNRRSRHKCQQNYARVQIPITQIFDAFLSK